MHCEICMVDMPFGCFNSPAIGVSILKAEAAKKGIPAQVEYGSLRLAEWLGVEDYRKLQGYVHAPFFAAEWLFKPFAGYEKVTELEEGISFYTQKYEGYEELFVQMEKDFLRLQESLDGFLEAFCERILSYHPSFVGCTYTFQQCNASLAILKKIKEKAPKVVTFLGGGGVTLNAGQALVDWMPQLDYAFTGESDDIFVDALEFIKLGEKERLYSSFPCVLQKGKKGKSHGTVSMDMVAYPDYDDYFRILRETGMEKHVAPLLLVEGSRGCWWGCRHRCRFCGLHGALETLAYRSKRTKRIVEELEYLTERYGVSAIMFTDCILSMEHVRELPKLLEGKGYRMFAEVKSNLSFEQLQGLKRAGFVALQPGIESLQDDLLQLMNKGNRAIKQVEFLKNATETGIKLAWNMMKRLPAEKEVWYQELMERIPSLVHLEPPNNNDLIYQRNSIFTTEQEAYGVELVPAGEYPYLYLNEEAFTERFAEYFEEKQPGQIPKYYIPLAQMVEAWRREYYKGNTLTYFVQGKFMGVLDTRSCGDQKKQVVTGLEKEICEAALQVCSISKVCQQLGESYSVQEVAAAIEQLRKKRLLLQIKDEILFLALQRGHERAHLDEEFLMKSIR